MDILEFAINMEKEGEKLYRDLALECDNAGLKSILIMLADEEVKHIEAVEKMRRGSTILAKTKILNDAASVFAGMKESGERFRFDEKQVEFYRQAQDIEKKSEEFYMGKAEEVDQKHQQELFLQLADQEKQHYFLLENIIEMVSRPDTWLENAEFHHLEEY